VKALQQLGLSQREACKSVHARRRSPHEVASSKAQGDARWATRLTEVAYKHSEHGCRRLYHDYERDADPTQDEYMNFKRFRRIYRIANLQIGRRRRRGRAKIVRGRPLRRATKPFEGWTLDFVHDRLFSGRVVRLMSMEDELSRTGLALEASFTFPSRSVTGVLDSVAAIYGYPKYLRIDNGPEFTSKIMQQWSEDHDVELLFIQPGKPTQNAFIESFNNRVRTEFLNSEWFHTLAEMQMKGRNWMDRYNTTHAHSALGYLTPEEFLALYETNCSPQKSVAA
jgi:putative transposase